MLKILGDLAQDDYFGLIIFDSAVDVWKAELLQAKEINLKQAKDFVKSITDRGGTVPQGLAFLPEWWEWCIAESKLSYRTKGKSSIKKSPFFSGFLSKRVVFYLIALNSIRIALLTFSGCQSWVCISIAIAVEESYNSCKRLRT